MSPYANAESRRAWKDRRQSYDGRCEAIRPHNRGRCSMKGRYEGLHGQVLCHIHLALAERRLTA